MDLGQIEFAANVIFELCRQHPELCPHQYEWRGSYGPNENGDTVNRYLCRVCGTESIRTTKEN